jgi:hypothetical protein
LSSKRVSTKPTEGVPVANRETQPILGFLSHDDFIWTVMFECKRIQAIWSFILNLADSLEEVLLNKKSKQKYY